MVAVTQVARTPGAERVPAFLVQAAVTHALQGCIKRVLVSVHTIRQLARQGVAFVP